MIRCLVALFLCLAVVRGATAAADEDAATIACRNAPTRHCLIQWASKESKEIREESRLSHALAAIAEAQAEAGEFEAAQASIDSMSAFYSKPLPPVYVAQAMAQAGGYDSALAMAKKIAESDQRSLAFDFIAEVAVGAGYPRTARNALDMALASAREIPEGSNQRRAILNAAEIFHSLGDDQTIHDLVDRFLKRAGAISANDERERTLNLVAALYALTGDFDAALATARDVHDEELQSWILLRIAEAQYKAGLAVAARTTLDAALKSGERSSESRSRDVARAGAINLLAENGEIQAALATAGRIEQGGLLAQLLSSMAFHLPDSPNNGGGREVLATILAMAEALDDAQWYAQTSVSIGVAQSRFGETETARKTFQRAITAVTDVEDASLRSSVYVNVATRLYSAGYVEQSQSAFDAALANAEPLPDSFGRDMAYKSIVGGYAEVGNFAMALAMKEKYLGSGWGNFALVSIAEAQAKSGTVAEALATVADIDAADQRVDALIRIAEALPR